MRAAACGYVPSGAGGGGGEVALDCVRIPLRHSAPILNFAQDREIVGVSMDGLHEVPVVEQLRKQFGRRRGGIE